MDKIMNPVVVTSTAMDKIMNPAVDAEAVADVMVVEDNEV
jgi:hypothetical protein